MISVHFQGKPFSVTVIQVYAPTTNAEEAKVEWFYENLQALLELTPKKKKCPFHHRGMQCRSRKTSDIWVMGKFGLGVQNETEQRLIALSREHTGYSKYPLPTT